MNDPVLKQVIMNLIYAVMYGLSYKYTGFEYTVILALAIITVNSSK